jgi:hypothetical protein
VLKKRKDGLVWRFGIPGEWSDVLSGILGLAWQGCYGLSGKWNSSAHFEVCYAYCYRDSFCSVVEINAVDGAVDSPVVCPKWDLVTLPETLGPVRARRSIAAASVFWQKCLKRLELFFLSLTFDQAYIFRPIRGLSGCDRCGLSEGHAGSSDPVEMVETHPKDSPFTPVDPISHQPLERGCRSPNGEPSRSFPKADLLLHSLFVPCV